MKLNFNTVVGKIRNFVGQIFLNVLEIKVVFDFQNSNRIIQVLNANETNHVSGGRVANAIRSAAATAAGAFATSAIGTKIGSPYFLKMKICLEYVF